MSGKMRALVRLFLVAAISFAMPVQSQEQEPTEVSRPNGFAECEDKNLPATFTCVLDINGTNINDDDVRWHRFIRDRDTTQKVDPDEEDITVVTSTNGTRITSILTVNNGRTSDTGFVWVEAQSHVYCNASLTIASIPPALRRINITGNVKDLSIVVQWDAVDDFFFTTYTIHWGDGNDQFDTADEPETSYTITGLTLDTAYTVRVTAANKCGSGPEFRENVILPNDSTSTTSTISPTITATTSSPTSTVTVTTSTDYPNPTFAIINSNSLDANTVDMTLLPTSIIDPSVTISINIPATIITTLISSPASSVSTMVVTVSTNPGSIITTTAGTTGPVFTTTSTNPTPSITTATTTATSDVIAVTTTATTTPSIAPTDTTTATAITSSIVPTDATDVAVSPTPTTGLTEPVEKGDDGFNLEDYRYIGAGVLGGLIVFIVIIVICCCCCCCRRRKGKRDVGSLKLDQYTTLSSEGSPQKDVPSVTNAMTIDVGQDGEPVKQGTDKIHQLSTTEANFTASDTSGDLDLNSQPLHPPDTYDRLGTIKPTDPTDVYDKLQPRQPLHPTNTYDKLPPSSTFDQLPSPNATYDKLPPSNTIHNFPNTYDRLPASNTSDNLPSNVTYDRLPSTPSNTYDRLPSSNTFDKLPSTGAYNKLPSSNTFHNFPLPLTPPNHYDTPPSSRILEKLPSTPTTSDRSPATDAHPSPQTKIEEVTDSNVTNTDDGAHYYDELPCNIKKDAHTGENAYQGEDVHYAILQPLPTPKNKLIYNDDPTKLYAQIA